MITFRVVTKAVVEFGGGGEEGVAAGVECRLDRILYHADDKADGHSLHGHIVADAEEGAGHGDEQQAASRHARGDAGTEGGYDAEEESRGKADVDAHCVGHREREDSDGHRRAVEEPLRMIVENAGLEGSVVVNEVKNGKADYGYNARTEQYENLFKSGVIDPAKVTRVALENAASIAGMLLTTECVLCDIKEPEPPMPAGNPGMGGMGGMY